MKCTAQLQDVSLPTPNRLFLVYLSEEPVAFTAVMEHEGPACPTGACCSEDRCCELPLQSPADVLTQPSTHLIHLLQFRPLKF